MFTACTEFLRMTLPTHEAHLHSPSRFKRARTLIRKRHIILLMGLQSNIFAFNCLENLSATTTNMPLRRCFIWIPFLKFIFSSSASGDVSIHIQLPKPINASSLPALRPTPTALPHYPAALGNFHVECDGATYGFNPNIVDCEDAKTYVVMDPKPRIFGERHTGLPDDIVPLPYRVMGGKQ